MNTIKIDKDGIELFHTNLITAQTELTEAKSKNQKRFLLGYMQALIDVARDYEIIDENYLDELEDDLKTLSRIG